MQNRYFGDIHDFYKYFLLNHISKYYTLGIHWCLVPDEVKKNDGKKKVTPKESQKDEALYTILNESRKNIEEIKKYFSQKVKYFEDLHNSYHLTDIYAKYSLKKLQSSEIVFFDPDNGIEVLTTNNKNKFKYVSFEVLSKFWDEGKSLIVYQHSDRNGNSIEEKIKKLCESLKCDKSKNIEVIKRGNVNYIFIINKKHYDLRDILADFICNNNEYKKYL